MGSSVMIIETWYKSVNSRIRYLKHRLHNEAEDDLLFSRKIGTEQAVHKKHHSLKRSVKSTFFF